MYYSETLLDHFRNPRNVGELDDADAAGVVGTPGQGNFMIVQLKLSDGRIRESRFRCHGCGSTIAVGSVVTTLVAGLTPAECAAIDDQAVMQAIDGLPPGKELCAGTGVAALRDALRALGVETGGT